MDVDDQVEDQLEKSQRQFYVFSRIKKTNDPSEPQYSIDLYNLEKINFLGSALRPIRGDHLEGYGRNEVQEEPSLQVVDGYLF